MTTSKPAPPPPVGARDVLSDEQKAAIGRSMIAIVEEHSESNYCASWRADIEHSLYDEAATAPDDTVAGTLRILSDLSGMWIRYDDDLGPIAERLETWHGHHSAWEVNQAELRARMGAYRAALGGE